MAPVRIQKLATPHISVIIATKNRQEDLIRVLRSLERNTFKNFEVIVADQSTTPKHIDTTQFPNLPKLIHVLVPSGGKSTALNYALSKARGRLLAFTDDDCIVSPKWVSVISQIAHTHTRQSAFFGRTVPYKPRVHNERTCPSIFTNTKRVIISAPTPHFQSIGFGNNMAIRKSAIESSGLFKTWLGPGSIGSNAEDAEMSIRLLIQHHTILYEPTMIVSHNRWLTNDQMLAQTRSYTCGETACYGYFAFQGFSFAVPIVKSSFHTIIRQIASGKQVLHELRHLLVGLWGLVVALWFTWRDPISKSKR